MTQNKNNMTFQVKKENEVKSMREKMYEIKKNNETKAFELKTIDFNFHSSLCQDGKVVFNKVFSREFARAEYFKLRAKYDNGNAAHDDVEKMNLLESKFEFNFNTIATTDVSGTPKELIGLMYLTLFANNSIIKSYDCTKDNDGNNVYKLKYERISLGMDTFYNKCKSTIASIKSGAITLENAVDTLKPLYNECTTLINHDASEKICKKWVESTKEKNTRLFIAGLLPTYKLNRSNRIDEKSPLKSQSDFEKYVAMWLVSGGTMVSKKVSGKDTVTMSSMIANAVK